MSGTTALPPANATFSHDGTTILADPAEGVIPAPSMAAIAATFQRRRGRSPRPTHRVPVSWFPPRGTGAGRPESVLRPAGRILTAGAACKCRQNKESTDMQEKIPALGRFHRRSGDRRIDRPLVSMLPSNGRSHGACINCRCLCRGLAQAAACHAARTMPQARRMLHFDAPGRSC